MAAGILVNVLAFVGVVGSVGGCVAGMVPVAGTGVLPCGCFVMLHFRIICC
jgi:hypothetical protein